MSGFLFIIIAFIIIIVTDVIYLNLFYAITDEKFEKAGWRF